MLLSKRASPRRPAHLFCSMGLVPGALGTAGVPVRRARRREVFPCAPVGSLRHGAALLVARPRALIESVAAEDSLDVEEPPLHRQPRARRRVARGGRRCHCDVNGRVWHRAGRRPWLQQHLRRDERGEDGRCPAAPRPRARRPPSGRRARARHLMDIRSHTTRPTSHSHRTKRPAVARATAGKVLARGCARQDRAPAADYPRRPLG